MKIDSHVHISYLWKKEEFSKIKGDLLRSMDASQIDYSIVIPDNVSNSPCADLETVFGLAKGEGRLFMLGALKIDAVNKENIDEFEKLFREKMIRGFKIFPGHDPVYPTDRRWDPIYELCVKYDFPLVIHTGINTGDKECAKYNDPKYVVEIAKKYPELKMIISHYFWSKMDYCFSMTEGVKNIYFDTSALADGEVVAQSGGIEKVQEVLTKTVRRDSNSVIFGTDWPMCDVGKHVDLINSLDISEKERDGIFFRNAISVFKLEV